MNVTSADQGSPDKNRSRFQQVIDLLTSLFNDLVPSESGPNESSESGATNAEPSIPPYPFGYMVDEDDKPCGFTAEDFSDMEFSEIRKRFAFDDGSGHFEGLKLLHHDPKTGNLRSNCVRAALAAIGGTQTGTPMDFMGKEDEVKQHLENHLKEIQPEEEAGGIEKMENEKQNTNLETEIKNLKAELTNKDTKITELTNKIASLEQEKKDAAWTALKNTLPPGLVDTEEKEKELRALAESSPLDFATKIANIKLRAPTTVVS